jgi:hypothetical protein
MAVTVPIFVKVTSAQRHYMEMIHTEMHTASQAVRLPLNWFFVKQKRTWRFVLYKVVQYRRFSRWRYITDGRTDGLHIRHCFFIKRVSTCNILLQLNVRQSQIFRWCILVLEVHKTIQSSVYSSLSLAALQTPADAPSHLRMYPEDGSLHFLFGRDVPCKRQNKYLRTGQSDYSNKKIYPNVNCYE